MTEKEKLFNAYMKATKNCIKRYGKVLERLAKS